jgi:hypothetical protein
MSVSIVIERDNYSSSGRISSIHFYTKGSNLTEKELVKEFRSVFPHRISEEDTNFVIDAVEVLGLTASEALEQFYSDSQYLWQRLTTRKFGPAFSGQSSGHDNASNYDNSPQINHEDLEQSINNSPQSINSQTITSPTGAVKHSAQKFKYSLIPHRPYEELAKLYTYGANKYSPRNWEKGFAWSDMIDALERHLVAFKSGEFNDKESGCKHMASVAFYAFGLMEFEHTHPELNNLPGFSQFNQPEFNQGVTEK